MSLLSKKVPSADSENIAENAGCVESPKNHKKNHKATQVSETASCNDVPVLRRAAMDYLARREHSFYELAQKLGKKFPDTDSELLTEVLDVLRAENLQSDERFTESYVRYRKSRGFAYLHIRGDLSARRVSEELINEHLLIDDEHWEIMADELVVKKLRNQEPLVFGSKLHRKLTRFLESRGFSPQESRKALDKHLA